MQERFTSLAEHMRETIEDQQRHGITPENSKEWQQNIYDLHVFGFEQHPPVTFNDLCRADRDYTFGFDRVDDRDVRGR
jgi:hypothetical protein